MGNNINSTDKIRQYIRAVPADVPIFTLDLYQIFPEIKRPTIRQIIRRMTKNDEIRMASDGIYYKPNPNRILNNSYLAAQSIIENKFIYENGIENNVIGYRTGLSFSNKLGLSTQVPNILFIVSNNVSNKKRDVYIEEARIIVNAPRTMITSKNFKLLQVLDLMNEYEKVSEIDLEDSKMVLLDYLDDIKITKQKLQWYMELYPLKAQINFYKSEVYYEIIKRQESI